MIIWMGWTVFSIITLVESLVRLATFQIYMPDWSMSFIFWHTRRNILTRKNVNKKQPDPQ